MWRQSGVPSLGTDNRGNWKKLQLNAAVVIALPTVEFISVSSLFLMFVIQIKNAFFFKSTSQWPLSLENGSDLVKLPNNTIE